MTRAAALFGALLLGGCLSYESGQRQRGELNCELLDVCGDLEALGYDGVGACKAAAASQEVSENDCPSFDAAAMQDCLDAYRTAIDAADCDADLTTICSVCG